MKTTLKITIVAIVVVAALAVLGAGFAFAQTMTPWGGAGIMRNSAYQSGTPAPGYGYGMMGGAGMMYGQNMMNGVDMNAMHQWMSTDGGMHNIIWGGLAETLGLTPDELNAELASGKTLTQIAETQGISQEQLATTLETSMKAGLDKAVADGALTQAQADQMLSHMSNNFGWMLSQMGTGGMGFGGDDCHGNIIPQTNS